MSAELLSQVSDRICPAKSWDNTAKDKPFGGVNVIFLGDIGQLCPLKSNALYSHALVRKLAPATTQTTEGQSALRGAFLWWQVDTVVELKQNWCAKNDAMFVDLLNCICVGKAKKYPDHSNDLSNYDLLKTCLLSVMKKNLPTDFASFKDAPIVVPRKFLRDALNDSKARSYAT